MPFSLKFLFRGVNAAEERDWERENVRQKTERYLATNPLDRYAADEPYRQKVDVTAAALEGITGPTASSWSSRSSSRPRASRSPTKSSAATPWT